MNQDGSTNKDYWRIVSISATTYAIIQFALVWYYPNSIWTWMIAVGVCVFTILMWFHPATRHYRRASFLFNVAVLSAMIPSLSVTFEIVQQAKVSLMVAGSSFVTVSLITAAIVMSLLDAQRDETRVDDRLSWLLRPIQRSKISQRQLLLFGALLFSVQLLVLALCFSSNPKLHEDSIVSSTHDCDSNVEVTIANSSNVTIEKVVGRDQTETTYYYGVNEETFREIVSRLQQDKDRLLGQLHLKDQTIESLASSIKRLSDREGRGDEKASKALKLAREAGDFSGILNVLESEVRAYESKIQADQRDLLKVRLEIAYLSDLNEDLETAEKHLRFIIEQTPGDLDAQTLFAKIQIKEGNFQEAKLISMKVMELAPDNPEYVGKAISYLAVIELEQGELQKAQDHLSDAIALFEKHDIVIGAGFANGNLGTLFLQQGKYEKSKVQLKIALDQLEGVLGSYKDVTQRYQIISAITDFRSNLGLVHYELGELNKAEALLNDALKLSQEIDDQVGIADRLIQLSLVDRAQFKYDQAVERVETALEVYETAKNIRGVRMSHFLLGFIAQAKGEYATAESCFNKSLEVESKREFPVIDADVFKFLGYNYYKQSRYAEAETWLLKAVELDQKLGRKRELLRDYNFLMHVYLWSGDQEKSTMYQAKALKLLSEENFVPRLPVFIPQESDD